MKRVTLWVLLAALLALSACEFGGTPATEAPAPTSQSSGDESNPGGESSPPGAATEAESSPEASATALPTETPAPTATPADPLAALDPAGQSVLLWHPYTGEQAERFGELVERFNQSNEWDIAITAEPIPDGGLTTLTTGEATSTPDLLLADPGTLAALPAAARRPWEAFAGSSSWGDETVRMDEATSTVAWGSSLPLLLVNEELLGTLGFSAPPTTWDEVEEMACAAAGEERIGWVLEYALEESDNSIFLALLAAEGVSAVEGDDFSLETPGVTALIERLRALQVEGCLLSGPSPLGPAATLASGEVLFTNADSSDLATVEAAVAAGYGGAWSAVPLPIAGDGSLLRSGNALALLADEETTQLAAWLFVRWLQQPEQQGAWLPGDAPLAGDASLETLLADAMPEPALPNMPVVRLILDDGLAQMIEGADIAETLPDLQDEANRYAQP